ncbi:MAG: lipopolysaccharide biosynthesis protein [Planctomyces sp.]|nr:lipopolysaccharide biosynthesis protein [Planctomyces sp.]
MSTTLNPPTPSATALPSLAPAGSGPLVRNLHRPALPAEHAPVAAAPSNDSAPTIHVPASSEQRPLRVCHVSLTLKTGGLERLLVDFARRYDHERVALTFLAMSDIGPFAEKIREAGCEVHQLKTRGRWNQFHEMNAFFRSRQFDVVHTHNTYPHLYATLAARRARVPVVVNTRHGQRLGHNWRANLQYRLTSKLVDRIVAVSDDAARLCVREDKLPTGIVTRIWNGIDLAQFGWRGSSQELTAITVSRLSCEKDIGTMLRAVDLVRRQYPAFKLIIVGDGAERAPLEKLTAELDLSSHVSFLGERHDVPELLAGAGFFVSSSLSEGISLTLLEAMAVGLPVVATAVGGNPEIILPGVTGLLAPAGNAEELARAMLEMCGQRNEWLAMGAAGRERVSEFFHIDRMIDDYTRLYETLCEAKAVQGRA